ncbi:MAG TPA: GNAT family N-acetyltransferase [Jatrophihabitans sp.]|nr:GNAT family N-acetyltransferase [Jatrophihabitans sp.]
MCTGNRLALRPLAVDDLPLLAEWITRPHVARWWYAPVGLAAVREEYLPCIEGDEPTQARVVEIDGSPAGFAQWYRWADNLEHAAKLGAAQDEAGFDYLLAEPRHCGRGIGTRLIAELIRQVRSSWPELAGLVVDPEQQNRASCRVLEKNGLHLVRVARIEDTDGYPLGDTAIYRCRFDGQS